MNTSCLFTLHCYKILPCQTCRNYVTIQTHTKVIDTKMRYMYINVLDRTIKVSTEKDMLKMLVIRQL